MNIDDVNDMQQKYLAQIVELVKNLWLENQGMQRLLEQSGDAHWEAALRMWCSAPEIEAEAKKRFQLLAAVIQKAKWDSEALKELSEALAQAPPGFCTKQN